MESCNHIIIPQLSLQKTFMPIRYHKQRETNRVCDQSILETADYYVTHKWSSKLVTKRSFLCTKNKTDGKIPTNICRSRTGSTPPQWIASPPGSRLFDVKNAGKQTLWCIKNGTNKSMYCIPRSHWPAEINQHTNFNTTKATQKKEQFGWRRLRW
jgi:hypothetical protein